MSAAAARARARLARVPRRELWALGALLVLSSAVVLVYVAATEPIELRGDMGEYHSEGVFFTEGKAWWTTLPFGIAHAGAWKAPALPGLGRVLVRAARRLGGAGGDRPGARARPARGAAHLDARPPAARARRRPRRRGDRGRLPPRLGVLRAALPGGARGPRRAAALPALPRAPADREAGRRGRGRRRRRDADPPELDLRRSPASSPPGSWPRAGAGAAGSRRSRSRSPR